MSDEELESFARAHLDPKVFEAWQTWFASGSLPVQQVALLLGIKWHTARKRLGEANTKLASLLPPEAFSRPVRYDHEARRLSEFTLKIGGDAVTSLNEPLFYSLSRR